MPIDEKPHVYKNVKLMHFRVKNFSCTFSNETFCAKDRPINHKDTVHQELKKVSLRSVWKNFCTLIRDFNLTICNKIFAQSYMLHKHVQIVIVNFLEPFESNTSPTVHSK